MAKNLTKIDEERLHIVESRFDVVDNISATEPQKVDSPRDILNKYARGQSITSYDGQYEDDYHTDEQMEESTFIEDEMDARQYLEDTNELAMSQKRPQKAEKVSKGAEVQPQQVTPPDGGNGPE